MAENTAWQENNKPAWRTHAIQTGEQRGIANKDAD